MNDLIENTVTLARADYDLKKRYDIINVDIITDYDPEIVAVQCVTMEIEQVVLNLIKNAVQAMGEAQLQKKHGLS